MFYLSCKGHLFHNILLNCTFPVKTATSFGNGSASIICQTVAEVWIMKHIVYKQEAASAYLGK